MELKHILHHIDEVVEGNEYYHPHKMRIYEFGTANLSIAHQLLDEGL